MELMQESPRPSGAEEGEPPELRYSHAEPEECEPILALHREAGWPGTHVEGEVWAAHLAGRLVASAQLIEIEPAVVLVDAVVVLAEVRNQGIGAQLMKTVLATRASHWWLECRLERVAFYQRLGFELVGESEVPALVKARVGSNHSRKQQFLHASTAIRESERMSDLPRAR
jgi:N-acetylglutamate synthase-like GNAT family acetyltransferase